MKQILIRLWRSFRFPLIVALGTLPLVLILAAYFVPVMLPFVWAIPLGYVVLDSLSTRIPGKWRLPYTAAELALTGVLGWYVYTTALDMLAMLIPCAPCGAVPAGNCLPAEKPE